VNIKNAIKFGEIFDSILDIYRHNSKSEYYRAVIGLERLAGIVYDSVLPNNENTQNYPEIDSIASGISSIRSKIMILKK